ncbi:MAG TPA: Imm8 family immunity protein [Acidobacteriaceae bacterium]|nr:Imm8 family immunity protein [Acidobacteriaceae bacterium]
MRPIIRDITIEHEPLESFRPVDARDFAVSLTILIGPESQPGEELFYLSICTAEWLRNQCEKHGYFFTGRRLVMDHWDFDLIKQFLDKRISTLVAESWEDLATMITRIAYWEFEDYREAPAK